MSSQDSENFKCKKCGVQCTNILAARFKWCNPCQISYFKRNSTNMNSGNKDVDNLIQEMQSRINSPFTVVFEWIPYNQFKEIKEIGKGCFSTAYSAIWKEGPLRCDYNKEEWKRESNKKVALKYFCDPQNLTSECLNEVKAHSMSMCSNILKIYGISQNPNTNDYIMVVDFAEGGNLTNWIDKNYKTFTWFNKIQVLQNITEGLREIHQKNMVHHHLHPRNILFKFQYGHYVSHISDMGWLCDGNNDPTKIYGIMPYLAPEVLKGKTYTQAADIYSFGMIMYFIATGRQPFANYAHDQILAANICNGIRPEINESEAPRCYVDLMKRCLDANPDNRPSNKEVYEMITLFSYSYKMNAPYFKLFTSIEKEGHHYDVENQFIEAEKYRLSNLSLTRNNQLNIHPQAVYTPRLLNPFIKVLSKYDAKSIGIADHTKSLTYNINRYVEREI